MARLITLVLEASTYHGSAALLDGSASLAERAVAMRGREHEALMPAVGELLDQAGVSAREIRRIVCGAGPGSFTSLRIAASIAKGLAMAVGATLIPVSSLALLVASRQRQKAGRYLATLDAMRGEHYAQCFQADEAGEVSPVSDARIIPAACIEQLAAEQYAIPLGPSRSGVETAIPHARSAVRLGRVIAATAPADLSAWEPAYGRLAEAQVKWESAHGRPLAAG